HKGNPGGGGDCVQAYSMYRPESYGPYQLHVYGNVCIGAGRHGVTVSAASGTVRAKPTVTYNTIVDVGLEVFGRSINFGSVAGTPSASYNIAVGQNASISSGNNTNNYVNTNKSAAGFVNVNAGNVRLIASSVNVNAAA